MFIKPLPRQVLLTGCSVDDFMFYHPSQVIWSPQCRQNLTHARVLLSYEPAVEQIKKETRAPWRPHVYCCTCCVLGEM